MEKIKTINQICFRHLQIDFMKQTALKDVNFFSSQIHAQPRELMLIMLDIENELQIKFPDQFIKEGGMRSFQSIVEFVGIHL